MAELMGDTWTHSKELLPVKRMQKVENINEIPNEILDGVFRLLDKESLRQTRLVCTKWDDVALEIMSHTRGRVTLHFEEDAGINPKGLEDIAKLQSMLPSCKYPGMLFTELILESPTYRDSNNGILVRQMPLLNLLQNCGSTLKCLELNNITLHLSILRPLIEKWCANLEELSCNYVTVVEDDSINIHDFEALPTPLKLNLRKFTFKDLCYQEPERRAAGDLVLSIINNSLKLQCLDAVLLTDEPDFWKKFQNLHHSTKNFEELRITLFGAEYFSLTSDISLSDKLRSLTLNIYDPAFRKEQLIIFFNEVGKSLEKLFLRMNIDYDDDDEAFPWKIELPLMKELKVLKYSGWCRVHFDPMDLLAKLPSLEMLSFESENCFLLESENVDAWFRNCWSLTRRPHEALNTLSIRGSPKYFETIYAINQMFPNLRELSVALDGTEIPEEAMESWLIRVFQGLSEMKNLKSLGINFHGWFEVNADLPGLLFTNNAENAGINFQACFSPLVASQSLEKLKIFSDTNLHPLRYLPPGLEKIFEKIPKLKVLTLQGLQIKELSDSRNLFKTLEKKGIVINLL